MRLPNWLYARLRYSSKSELCSGWFMSVRAHSTYIRNRKERMLYRVWIARKSSRVWTTLCYIPIAGPLGVMGRELARQTSKPSSNPSWDATVHPTLFSEELYPIFKIISQNFKEILVELSRNFHTILKENFTQFLRKFYVTFKFYSILKRIWLNF